MDEITYDFLWMPVVSARSKAEVFGVSVHGCRRCGVEGDGEDGGPEALVSTHAQAGAHAFIRRCILSMAGCGGHGSDEAGGSSAPLRA